MIRIKNLNEELDRIYLNDGDYYDTNIKEVIISEREKIILYSPMAKVFGLNANVRVGEYRVLDKEYNEYVPDFSLTAIINEHGEIIYWKQDDIAVTINNYLNMLNKHKTFDKIQNMICEIIQPDVAIAIA